MTSLFLVGPGKLIFNRATALSVRNSFCTDATRTVPVKSKICDTATPTRDHLLAMGPDTLFDDCLARTSKSVRGQKRLTTRNGVTLVTGRLSLRKRITTKNTLALLKLSAIRVHSTVSTPFIKFTENGLLIRNGRRMSVITLDRPSDNLCDCKSVILQSTGPMNNSTRC